MYDFGFLHTCQFIGFRFKLFLGKSAFWKSKNWKNL
jgi:hypothetical protein